MRQYTATWNGTMTQARALVEAWKKEQEEKKRMHKMGLWFAKPRLEYLREQIEKECISYGEIAELKSLAEYIEAGDVVLLEWAEVGECDGKHGSIKEILDCGDCSKMLDVLY